MWEMLSRDFDDSVRFICIQVPIVIVLYCYSVGKRVLLLFYYIGLKVKHLYILFSAV